MTDAQASIPASGESLLDKISSGLYIEVLLSAPAAEPLIQTFIHSLGGDSRPNDGSTTTTSNTDDISIGIAAFNAFLQTNVTGPVLENVNKLESTFEAAAKNAGIEDGLDGVRRRCLKSLEVDGVPPYAYIPNLELFAFARHVFATTQASLNEPIALPVKGSDVASTVSLQWLRLRVLVWHFRLLTQPSLSGSSFARSMHWIDVPSLADSILGAMAVLREAIVDDVDVWSLSEKNQAWSQESKVELLLEQANIYIMLGRDETARHTIAQAAKLHGFVYALSGALGRRTKWQDKTTSQLVVLAKSGVDVPDKDAGGDEEAETKPDDVALNDDTLLENIEFTKEENGKKENKALPEALADLAPDEQPALSPLDQIILLTEATLRDSFSPADTITAEEVLPYAVRVVSDKSTNWQIYTQALLVRSRIEMHRSRTIERGVLQMQALVDQVIVDTEQPAAPVVAEEPSTEANDSPAVPLISISGPDSAPAPSAAQEPADKPTSFLRGAKATDSAPAHVRLQYLHALASPPRWHLESELAHSWAGIGSLVSALEIFKRLRLWAEVALCMAATAAADEDDDSARGSGGYEKAKGILRWRLFHRTGAQVDANTPSDPDAEELPDDVTHLNPALFTGPERTPPVPDAPRLWCLLGDLETNADHYERAWTVSEHRYARAQKSLGEHYLQKQDLNKAYEAYTLATQTNRLNPELWSRLGDISLRLSRFGDAADAYRRAITSTGDPTGGEDARTWSNLGGALWSLYLETIDKLKKNPQESNDDDTRNDTKPLDDEDETIAEAAAQDAKEQKVRDPALLISQSLVAFKRGATLSADNWRIWDNVLTLSMRCRPPAYRDALQAVQAVIRIRNAESALDAAVLRALLQDVVFSQTKKEDDAAAAQGGEYDPPRGSLERAAIGLMEELVVPLITVKSELWELVSRERLWRRDYKGAVEAAEKGWRAAMGSVGAAGSSGLMPSSSDGPKNWLEDKEAFDDVVARTDELVTVLENFGEKADGVGPKWRSKAKSAVRSVMGRGKDPWEGTDGWKVLEGLMGGLEIKR